MNQKPNVILLHNNQNESRFLDHLDNLLIITNSGNFNWAIDGKEVMAQSVEELHHLHFLTEIIGKLKNLSPTFSRHYDDQPLMELNYRKIALVVINLASILKEKNVKIIVFPFGANHWLEGFILELAGELVEAKLVFLYATAVDSRLLPLVQTKGVQSRRVISQEYADFSLDSDVLTKIKMTVDNSHPKTFDSRYIPFEKISMFLIYLYYVKNFFIRQKTHFLNQLVEISSFNLGTELRVFRQQNKAIQWYLKRCESDSK